MHFLLFLRSGNSSYQEELFLKDHFIGAYTLNKETSMLSFQWKDNKVHKVKRISLYTGIAVFISQRNFNSLKKKELLKYPINFKIISWPTEIITDQKSTESLFLGGVI